MDLEAVGNLLRADNVRLQQVFWNLIRNAVKFTPRHGKIALHSSNPQDIWFRLEIIDNGIGIIPDALSRIFDPFEQAGGAGFGGLGLGLTISKAIVELHGGRIFASSAGPDLGAMFIIELPNVVLRSTECPAPKMDVTTPTPNLSKTVAALRRILLVDDHADSVRPMQLFLEAIGYQVIAATSVGSALRIALQEEFDLLVSDIGLPDGSGENLIRQLRDRGHKLPSIALSGHGMKVDIERSLAAGFQVHLTKPVSPQRLQATIDQLIRQPGNAPGE
jgi:CheY-like chemotaxis protein